MDAARKLAAAHRPDKAAISAWGASGIFDELTVAEPEAGIPSVRTLLLLYAADLAFRLRWEIRPALEEGRLVIAAPYVATAIALGQAAGLEPAWLTDLFSFAPAPSEHHVIEPPARPRIDGEGFTEFAWRRIDTQAGADGTRRQLTDAMRRNLRALARRPSRATS